MITTHIITLFPESFSGYLNVSILKIAQNTGLFSYNLYNLADYSVRNTRRVDDRPYGGGPGTLITIEPLTDCIRHIQKLHGNMPIILMSPRGDTLSQPLAQTLATAFHQYIIICGHYEGVDARIHQLFDIREISIGNYVLSSGEIAAMTMIDSMVRLIPGVLSPLSLAEESFSPGLERKKEYPQYSRPEIYEDIAVPSVLLSGDLKKIRAWNHAHSYR